MTLAEVMEAMAAAGCSPEQITTVTSLLDLRTMGAKRQARYRQRNKSVTKRNAHNKSVTKRLKTPDEVKQLVDWFQAQWNGLASGCGLARIQAMTEKRERGIRCRADDLVKALGFPDAQAGFMDIFNRIRGSPFLRGAQGWKCDVDWLLAESNFLKVYEGKYAQDRQNIRQFHR